jgi:hypothetical protein
MFTECPICDANITGNVTTTLICNVELSKSGQVEEVTYDWDDTVFTSDEAENVQCEDGHTLKEIQQCIEERR